MIRWEGELWLVGLLVARAIDLVDRVLFCKVRVLLRVWLEYSLAIKAQSGFLVSREFSPPQGFIVSESSYFSQNALP